MTPETRTLVRYRLERAREALAEVVVLLDSGHANTALVKITFTSVRT